MEKIISKFGAKTRFLKIILFFWLCCVLAAAQASL